VPPLTTAGSGWIFRSPAAPGKRLRLFCFPYAGGAASVYRTWGPDLPAHVDVCPIQLPGRGSRFREAPFRLIGDLVTAAADALRPSLEPPYVLFGHSMGALIAFELTRELRRRGAAMPALLVVSGHPAPQRPDPDPPIGHLSDPEFLHELQTRYDGIPPEVLAEQELLQLLLPVLRSDILVIESHSYRDEPPLPCPIACFGGEEDGHVQREDLEAWREQTALDCTVRFFRGGHFFLESERAAVLAALGDELSRTPAVRA
jgi:surfactin synthase thioesterase subunit